MSNSAPSILKSWNKLSTVHNNITPDEIFVLGDQRNISTSDSRTLGPIKYEDCWKLRVRYWPYHRFKTYE